MRHEEIPRVTSANTEEHRALLAKRMPFVSTTMASGWPAQRRWGHDYLKSVAGDAKATCMVAPAGSLPGHIGLGGWREPAMGRPSMEMRLDDYVDRVWNQEAPNTHLRSPIPRLLAPLMKDIEVPEAIADARGRRPETLWMGAAGTVTPLHYDTPDNLHTLVVGAKRFLLCDRRELVNLYPHGIFSGRYPHTSQIPDLGEPDLSRFPKLRSVCCYEATLAPGQTIFIPSGWWHQVYTLKPSAAVNHWWPVRGLPHWAAVRLALFAVYVGLSRRTQRQRPSYLRTETSGVKSSGE